MLQIAGILLDETPDYSRSSGAAALVTDCDVLERVELVFKVDGESALPLAIEGQRILGGPQLLARKVVEKEGHPVAIATTEGSALKRVGKAVPNAPHVRIFESIGGLGESMLVRTEDVEDDSFGTVPLFESARQVLGVLYEIS